MSSFSSIRTQGYFSLKSFTLAEYEQLVARSIVLERDRNGIKVLRTPENLIVKLFRRKRFWSSALFKSYACRFAENAYALHRLGIRTVDIINVFYCEPIERSMVFYKPISGETLRNALNNQNCPDDVMGQFAHLLAELHDKGVLFRSIHLNNVIVSDSFDSIGLIDISDMKIMRKSLSLSMRARNFKHLNRYRADQESLKSYGVDNFMKIYFGVCSLSGSQKIQLQEEMARLLSVAGRE
jgi:tRNA A-37 threonylcarbamoyl transferase component Bud32